MQDLTPDELKDTRVERVRQLIRQIPESKRQLELVDDIWAEVEVKSVTVDSGEKENFYHLTLADGEIILNDEDSLSCRAFRIAFQRIYGILLPNISFNKWAAHMTGWLEHRQEDVEKEGLSEKQEVIDAILEYLTSSRLVKGVGGAVFGTIYYYKDSVLVPNDIVKKLIVRVNRTIKMRQASNMLRDYSLNKTQPIRTPEGVVRMWMFDPKACGIDVSNVIELGSDEDD